MSEHLARPEPLKQVLIVIVVEEEAVQLEHLQTRLVKEGLAEELCAT